MLTDVQSLAAFLYMRMAEQMPEDAEDEWFLQSESAGELLSTQLPRLELFIQRTEELLLELETLVLDPNEPASPQYMTLFYDAAKDTFDHDKTLLRTYFMWLYYVLYNQSSGSRWGEMVDIMGVGPFNEMVRDRFQNLRFYS